MGIENSHERGPRRVRRETDGSFTPLVEVIAELPAGSQNIGDVDVVTLPTWAAVAVSADDTDDPADDAAAVVTYPAGGAGVSHVITGIAWSYDEDPTTAGRLTVEDGAENYVFDVDVTSKGPGFFPFPQPKKGSANTAMIITLSAGGTGIGGKVNALNHWTE